MTMSPKAALGRVSGWEQAEYQELSGGLTNRTWLVSVDNKRGVLKLDPKPRGEPYNDRLAEQIIQNIAADAEIANSVLYADECVYLTEYIDGGVWSAKDLDRDKNLEKLVSVLRRLHSLPLTGRSADTVDAASRYIKKIDIENSFVAKSCVDIVRKLHAPQNLCCCHNDLVASNIIATPDLRLLDWEYACDNDPFFDLATVVAHHDLSPSRADFLLDCYFDGRGERWREKLEQQMTLYNALVWLWYASRTDPDPEQLLAFEARLG